MSCNGYSAPHCNAFHAPSPVDPDFRERALFPSRVLLEHLPVGFLADSCGRKLSMLSSMVPAALWDVICLEGESIVLHHL